MAKLITPFKIDKKGKILNSEASYKPGRRTKDRFSNIRTDFEVAQNIMDSTYEEFGITGTTINGGENDLITRMNANQKMFNQAKPAKNADPDLQWHSNALKPIVRNKVISIVSHVTSQVLYPNVIAQNDDAVEDKDMADVMLDAVIWACEQSKYEDMFIEAVQDMCVNPAVILYQDYAKVKRKVKYEENGQVNIKEIVDEIYSGFFSQIIPLDELFIGNIYEPNIQKQPFLIRRKVIDYVAAERKYSDHPDFKYVSPGTRFFFDDDNDLFYEDYDEQQEDRLVEEVVYYNRFADLELVVVNGVMLCDPDKGMRRKDKMYPFAKSVYETYNPRFFYGMSLVQKLENDEELVNTLYRMILDGTYLQLMPPWAVYGEDDLDASDFAPRSITSLGADSKVEPMQLGQNLTAGMNTLQMVEKSMADSSKQDFQAKSDTTAKEIAFVENQEKISLGRIGKMVGALVRDYGQLLLNSIVQYMPIAELGELVGDSTQLKFPVLFLSGDEKDDNGNTSKRIEFTEELPEADTKEELEVMEMEESYKMLDEEDEANQTIGKVRPSYFRELKYKTKIDGAFISSSTKFAKKMMMFDRLLNNPNIEQKKLIKSTILQELEPGHEDEFILDAPDPMMAETEKMATPSLSVSKEAFNA